MIVNQPNIGEFLFLSVIKEVCFRLISFTVTFGGSTVSNISGTKWFVSFIDDCTQVTWVYLLKNKSDVSYVFPNFANMIKTQFNTPIKRFRSDNARDYFNQIMSSFFKNEGIIHESSCVNTPQQNGVVERKMGHLLSITRSLLFHKNVPKNYWGKPF